MSNRKNDFHFEVVTDEVRFSYLNAFSSAQGSGQRQRKVQRLLVDSKIKQSP